jgi:hypothetical protein
VAGTTGCGSVARGERRDVVLGIGGRHGRGRLRAVGEDQADRLRSAMTWFAVSTVPSAATITPVPSAPRAVRTTATEGPTRW